MSLFWALLIGWGLIDAGIVILLWRAGRGGEMAGPPSPPSTPGDDE